MQCNAMQMWCQCRCPSHIGNLERLQVANISEFMVSMEASVPGKWSGAGTPRIQRSLSFHHPLHRRLVYCQLRGRRRAPARCPSPPQRHSSRKICCIRRSTALWQAEEFTEKNILFSDKDLVDAEDVDMNHCVWWIRSRDRSFRLPRSKSSPAWRSTCAIDSWTTT
jgi:hypothetical protein